MQALAAHYGFDPATTPWNEMSPEAQHAFLYGDPAPMEVHFRSRIGREHTHTATFPGFYGFVRDWDTGGTYTDPGLCPECGGAGLRAEYLAVTLGGAGLRELARMPLEALAAVLARVIVPAQESATAGASAAEPAGSAQLLESSLRTARERLRFLLAVGLGYLHLQRPTSTLSAGEAQRVRLAGLLGSGLTALTVLLDEPTRGLHPSEVEALLGALVALRDAGNTVVVVEHDPLIMRAADHLLDMGPGAGAAGGRVIASGAPPVVAAGATPTAPYLRALLEVAP